MNPARLTALQDACWELEHAAQSVHDAAEEYKWAAEATADREELAHAKFGLELALPDLARALQTACGLVRLPASRAVRTVPDTPGAASSLGSGQLDDGIALGFLLADESVPYG